MRRLTIELKSKGGRLTPSQRAAREALLQAGADWFECRSPNAVMQAVRQAGVPLNMIVQSNGTIGCWRQPELEPWEVPRRDPAERQPSAPALKAQLRKRQQRWRDRQRAHEDAEETAP